MPKRTLLAAVVLSGLSCQRPYVPLEALLAFGPYAFDSSMVVDPSYNVSGSIPCVPCPPATCPTGSTCRANAACTGGNVCDPDPYTFELASQSVDLLREPQISAALSSIHSLTLESAAFCIRDCGYTNTLNFAVPPIDIYWGPSDAVNTMSAGVYRLGTTAALPAMAADTTSIAIEPTGADALSQYVTNPSNTMIRFFARGTVDFSPGDSFPMGAITFMLHMQFHVVGDPIGAAGG